MPTEPRRLARALPWASLAFALLGVPALYAVGAISIQTVNQMGRFTCFAIVALGLDLLWGRTGILSMCQSMFFCIGGYAMGMYLAMHGPLDGAGIPRALYVVSSDVSGMSLPWFWKPFASLPAAVLLGLLLPGLAAAVLGFLSFRSRVRGVYFSILTQAVTLAVWMVFSRNETRLCGTNGLTNFVSLAGHDLSTPGMRLALYLVSVLALAAAYGAGRWLMGRRLGRILTAVRDNENRLRFSGYKPSSYKIFVFALSAVFAGVGGMLYAPQMGIVTPSQMTVEASILVVIWVAVGGRGTLSGAVLGALLVNFAYSFLTSWWASSWLFVQGGLFVAVVLWFPDGIMGLLRRHPFFRPAARPAAGEA